MTAAALVRCYGLACELAHSIAGDVHRHARRWTGCCDGEGVGVVCEVDGMEHGIGYAGALCADPRYVHERLRGACTRGRAHGPDIRVDDTSRVREESCMRYYRGQWHGAERRAMHGCYECLLTRSYGQVHGRRWSMLGGMVVGVALGGRSAVYFVRVYINSVVCTKKERARSCRTISMSVSTLTQTYGLARELAHMIVCMTRADTRSQYSLKRYVNARKQMCVDTCYVDKDIAFQGDFLFDMYPPNDRDATPYHQDARVLLVNRRFQGSWKDEISLSNDWDDEETGTRSYRPYRRGRTHGAYASYDPGSNGESRDDWELNNWKMGEPHGQWKTGPVGTAAYFSHGLRHGMICHTFDSYLFWRGILLCTLNTL